MASGTRVYEHWVNDVRVMDGDSTSSLMDLGHSCFVRVVTRLAGIDTPERTTLAGKLVTRVVQQWFKDFEDADRSGFLKWRSSALDKFRRSLGDFFDSEHPTISLIAYLRHNGLCIDYTGSGPRLWHESLLKSIEERAVKLLNESGPTT